MHALNNILHESNTEDFSKSDFLEKLNRDKLNFVYLGNQDYHVAWDLQRKINELNKLSKL